MSTRSKSASELDSSHSSGAISSKPVAAVSWTDSISSCEATSPPSLADFEIASSSTSAASISAEVVRVDSGKRRLEVGEGLLRRLGERDRLLDLEGEGDLAVVGATVVLDRHEVEEADELLGSADLFLGREGRRGEPVDLLQHLVAIGAEVTVVAAKGVGGDLGECLVDFLALLRGALRLKLWRDDLPVPVDERRALGERRVIAALGCLVGLVEEGGQARLVGVVEVLANAEDRLVGGDLAGLEIVEGAGRIDAGTREAGDLAEVANEEPGACASDLAVGSRIDRDVVGAMAHRRQGLAPGGGQSDLVAFGDGLLRVFERGFERLEVLRGGLRKAGGERARERKAGIRHVIGGLVAAVEDQARACVEEVRGDRVGVLVRSLGRRRLSEGQNRERCECEGCGRANESHASGIPN